MTDRSPVRRRLALAFAVLAFSVAALFAAAAALRDAPFDLRLMWAGIGLGWVLVGLRVLPRSSGAGSATGSAPPRA